VIDETTRATNETANIAQSFDFIISHPSKELLLRSALFGFVVVILVMLTQSFNVFPRALLQRFFGGEIWARYGPLAIDYPAMRAGSKSERDRFATSAGLRSAGSLAASFRIG